MVPRIWRRILANVRRSRFERDLDEELRYHLDREAERLRRDGLSEADARVEARRCFGGVERAREAARDAHGVRLAHDLRQDASYAWRAMTREPGFAVTVTATIALALAANTTLFSIVYGVLLQPLPFPDAGRLVAISEESGTRPRMPVSYPDYLDWRARQHVFDDLGADLVIGGILTGNGEPERVFGRAVTRSFFSTLQVPFALGRPFTESEDRAGGPHVVVLGHGLWQRRYGSDAQIIGKTVTYNGEPFIVVGVLPPDFEFYGRANANNDFFMPLGQSADEHYMTTRDTHPLHVTGRLRAGVTLRTASAEMDRIAAALAREHRETNADVGVGVRSLLDDYVGDARVMLLLLFASAGLVLVIACANISSLLLARMMTRQRERAMRVALGASRARLLRQLLTESLMLAVIGGTAGVLLAAWSINAVPQLAPEAVPRVADISMNWRVAGFGFALSLLAGIGFGVAPAFAGRRTDPRASLGCGPRGTGGGRRLREAFVLGQIALSVLLLTSAGLVVRSFNALRQADLGYEPEHVVTMRVRLPDARYAERSRVVTFLDALLTRVATTSGVQTACLTTGVPLGRANEERYVVQGQTPPPAGREPVAITQWVTDGYFRTFRVGLVAGRYFGPADRDGAANVAIVDEEYARRHAAGGHPSAILGSHVLVVSEGDRWREVVGVVRHVRHGSLDETPRAEVYAPYWQMEPAWQTEIGRAMDVAVRSTEAPEAVVAAVRAELRALDPELPLSHAQALTSAVSASAAPRAFGAFILAAFATAALLLSAIGIFGVMSHTVAQQTGEIGIRLALGAQRRQVLTLVLRRALIVIGAGAVGGVVAARAAGGLFGSLLYGVTATDLVSYGFAAAALSAVALAASWLPARRALRVDPLIALRQV